MPHTPSPFLTPSRRWDGRTVGLYGGSFNPAHAGHQHVSARAIARLKLDALWWLVSPLNPLKDAADMAPLDVRIKTAQNTVIHPKIHVIAAETELGTHYSLDTIRQLQKRYVRTRFIWVMGADNLATFHHWKGWRSIFAALPIAVIDRPGYSCSALISQAARTYRACRVLERQSPLLKRMHSPAWVFLPGPLHSASATAIRATTPNWMQSVDDLAH